MPFRTILLLSIFFCQLAMSAQKSSFGLFYEYGAYFNFHSSNDKYLLPSDGSGLGAFYELDNGDKALGFRAGFGWRHNDCRYELIEHSAIVNNQQSFELKLQCTFPLSSKSKLALGIGPRIVTESSFSIEYRSTANGTHYEETHGLPAVQGDLNELNTALCLSWYRQVHGKFSVALHLNQDMLTLYHSNVSFETPELIRSYSFNAMYTGLSASMILHLR